MCSKKVITQKELKYFTYYFKNDSCLGKMYLLPKTRKRLYNFLGRPVISNCGTSTEKMSEFLDHHLQPVMKGGKSYIKATNHFTEKLKKLGKVPPNAILVTADVVDKTFRRMERKFRQKLCRWRGINGPFQSLWLHSSWSFTCKTCCIWCRWKLALLHIFLSPKS